MTKSTFHILTLALLIGSLSSYHTILYTSVWVITGTVPIKTYIRRIDKNKESQKTVNLPKPDLNGKIQIFKIETIERWKELYNNAITSKIPHTIIPDLTCRLTLQKI